MTIPYNVLTHLGFLDKVGGPVDNSLKLYLSDWVVLRHLEELSINTPTSLSEDDYLDLVSKRQYWRKDSINHKFNSEFLKVIGLEGIFNS